MHVHRISNRLGLVSTKTPEETEFALMKKIPKKFWLEINDTFVMYGQNICKPISPMCEVCRIRRAASIIMKIHVAKILVSWKLAFSLQETKSLI